MSGPVRIQLRRTKGWRKPPNTVSAARPGPWGNPHVVCLDEMRHTGDEDEHGEPIMQGPWLCRMQPDRLSGWWFSTKAEAAAKAVELYRWRLTKAPMANCAALRARLPDLRGKNLGCWCRLCDRHAGGKPLDEDCPDCDPCHVDPLGKLANCDSGRLPEGHDREDGHGAEQARVAAPQAPHRPNLPSSHQRRGT